MTIGSNNGLIHLNSTHSVPQTMNALEAVVRNPGLTVATRMDNSRDAATVGLKMKPTELLIFGNPRAGTPLMIASRPVAIGLPLKALAWEDAYGRLWLSYNNPQYLHKRQKISGVRLGNIAGLRHCAKKLFVELFAVTRIRGTERARKDEEAARKAEVIHRSDDQAVLLAVGLPRHDVLRLSDGRMKIRRVS